jgi:RHS repeat-associated protein
LDEGVGSFDRVNLVAVNDQGSEERSRARRGGIVGCDFHTRYQQIAMMNDATADTTYFVHKDHLGSTRILSTVAGGVYDSMDYLPFGEQIAGGSGSTHKFTGKERDSESGLDNFGARYMSSNLGRFMSPDEFKYINKADPQTLNLYGYVANNPINSVDPTGHASEGSPGVRKYMVEEHGGDPADEGGEGAGGGEGPDPNSGTSDGNDTATGSDTKYYLFKVTESNGDVSYQWAAASNSNDAMAAVMSDAGLCLPNSPTVEFAAPPTAKGSGNNVLITYADGSVETRSGGTRAWRNDNPGNIRSGDFANSQGAIGEAGGFAVFASEGAGQAAITALLKTATYQSLTVGGALSRYAPPNENDTANYQKFVQNATGLDAGTRMNSLSNNQLGSVSNAIRNIEGWNPGTVTYRGPNQ